MFIIKTPTPVSSGVQLQAEIQTSQSCVGFEIINDSPLAFNLGLPNGNTNYMAPQSTKFFIGPNYRAGLINIYPISVLSNVPAGFPSNVIIVGFNEGDDLPSYGATDIGKLVYVAGTVNVPTPVSVKNDGNAPGTQFIEATPSDAASSTVVVKNDGTVTIKGDNAGVLTTLLQLIAGASPAVKLAAAAVLTEALGNMKVDGTLETVGAATMDGTLTVTGDATFNGATPSLTTANDIVDNGNLAVNKNLQFIDNGANKRLFATNDATTNDFIVVNNANHGLTHFRKSDALTDIFTMADTLAVAFAGPVNPGNPFISQTNGHTNGTATLWMPLQGTGLKLAFLFLNNFRNATTDQDIALPTAFVNFAFGWIGNVTNPTVLASGIHLKLAGVAQNVNVYQGSNVAPSFGSSVRAMNIIEAISGFDTITMIGNAGATGNSSAVIMLVGI